VGGCIVKASIIGCKTATLIYLEIPRSFRVSVQSPKIIMTGLKLIPLTFSFETDLWGKMNDVLL
jgi:hypothetical protein